MNYMDYECLRKRKLAGIELFKERRNDKEIE